MNETNYKISIEAGRSDTWSKFIGENGMSFGVEEFGKSAPYKEIFKDFKLTANEISNKTKNIINKKQKFMTIKIGINGLGRIGRMVVRTIFENNFKDIKIKHINNRSNSQVSSNLLKYDSVHGKFNQNIKFNKKFIKIGKHNNIFFSRDKY